jgi:hypothetical protein
VRAAIGRGVDVAAAAAGWPVAVSRADVEAEHAVEADGGVHVAHGDVELETGASALSVFQAV